MVKYFGELQEQKNLLEAQGFTVAYICLQGSQNYGLDIYTDDYMSDIDMKAIVVPSLDELVRGTKMISTDVDTKWGKCDIKDIRKHVQQLLKGNPSWLETMYTPYYIVDKEYHEEIMFIREKMDELVYMVAPVMVRAIYGMQKQKEEALKKPYEGLLHKIEKYGFDGKQAHHIFRLEKMIVDYCLNDEPYAKCICPSYKPEMYDWLMGHKLNKFSLEQTEREIKESLDRTKEIRDSYIEANPADKRDYSLKTIITEYVLAMIKTKITNDLMGK